MHNRLLFRIGIGVASAATLTLTTVHSASAASSTPSPSVSAGANAAASGQTLASIKAKCSTQVQDRETALTSDTTKINAAASLTSSDKAALLAIESGDSSGLTALNATIQADTTVQQARTDCQKIVTDYHVYVLFEPQMRMVIAADAMTATDAKLGNVANQLQQKLGGNSNPTIVAALADLNKQVAAAQSSLSGISAADLALTPSGYPGNKSTLESTCNALKSAKGDFTQARTDIQTIRNALKGSAKSGTHARGGVSLSGATVDGSVNAATTT